jgi:cupin 2 domain-containing protein
MTVLKNLFAHIPLKLPDELSEIILEEKAISIERIVSRGHASPAGFWYDQEDNEWVVLLKGSAGLRFAEGDESVALYPGDYILIPARRRHRVDWTDPDQDTVWLAVHYR